MSTPQVRDSLGMEKEPSPEPLKGRIRRNLKAFGSVVATTIALSVPGIAEAKPQPAKLPRSEISLKLKHVIGLEQAAGHELKVTAQQRAALKASAVSILSLDRRVSLGGTCSGNAVGYLGNKYVTTAAHCFYDATWVNNGLLRPRERNDKALDFFKLSTRDVSLHDQSYPVYKTVHGVRRVSYFRSPPPMAYIKGLSIGLRRGDDALLQPDTRRVVSPNRSRTFDQVVPLAYNPAIEPPAQGQAVALYSIPGFRNVGVSATGIYAGRMTMPGQKRQVDVVVEHANDETHDPCSPGGSGFTGLLADNHQLTGLSRGQNFGYGHSSDLLWPNKVVRDDIRRQWRHFEAELGVNIPTKYNSLCFFDVSDEQTMPNLVGAFGVYATKHVQGTT